ncbi:DNA-binding transcriptional regulator, PadR family [Dehalogenimonas formicexedens]|uniref:DNA-binding transcriptional regulator, PadR family n=1 Tax=Dehalogenimonas formicexedens TaxID=1839801 RepID=A0A1P8F9F0_9CHLR|nr:PadR family transcriptional regulator [Dehalogenimonas formicexedens]APV45096.1 DNA-binding transcriptional regulator, PadR family [Dehalogenimonas formicexedens]
MQNRLFPKGSCKYLILDLLAQKACYGYQIIGEISECFDGVYKPSAGMIYPALDWLVSAKHIVAKDCDGRKVFSITPQGFIFLNDCMPALREAKKHMKTNWKAASQKALKKTLAAHKDMLPLIKRRLPELTREQAREITRALDRAHKVVDLAISSRAPVKHAISAKKPVSPRIIAWDVVKPQQIQQAQATAAPGTPPKRGKAYEYYIKGDGRGPYPNIQQAMNALDIPLAERPTHLRYERLGRQFKERLVRREIQIASVSTGTQTKSQKTSRVPASDR